MRELGRCGHQKPATVLLLVSDGTETGPSLMVISAQALRCVFDEYRRPLNSKITFAFFHRAAPWEPSFGKVLLHVIHFLSCGIFAHYTDPFAGERPGQEAPPMIRMV